MKQKGSGNGLTLPKSVLAVSLAVDFIRSFSMSDIAEKSGGFAGDGHRRILYGTN